MSGDAGVSVRTAVAPAAAAKRRVEEGLETLRAGLAPCVEKHMRDRHGEGWRRFASRGARAGTDGRRQQREG